MNGGSHGIHSPKVARQKRCLLCISLLTVILVVYLIMFMSAFRNFDDGHHEPDDNVPHFLDTDEPFRIDEATIEDNIDSFQGVLVFDASKR